MIRRERKSRKLRGRSRSMGWGRVGQHRKAGARGGKGAAGLDKHKWTWTIKYAPHWYGKRGFLPRRELASYERQAMNVGDLAEVVEKMKMSGNYQQEEGLIVVDLSSMGVEKLLGEGEISTAVKVIVPQASESAVKKIESVGGKVVLSQAQG
ncbi:MAG: 50S ribosomal protein L15 [Acidilobaceae archaeon]|nr:50S ribosomal protein L15 [Acidilobaceae archaeon]MCX8165738.1 50S ribosomal protein L15 [Acidilobaceae archaeon]MDW7974163.1 uL15m family ribosomal protein [Sulfolobales archaeon]